MESYEKEWLADQPLLLAIMHIVGLFDRPASADCLQALREKPAIEGLTDAIVGIDEANGVVRSPACARSGCCRRRKERARGARCPSAGARMVRRELTEKNETAWRAAHSRLYDHLRDTTKEGDRPTLEQLAPLYQAIAHGCRAGRHQEALDDIYVDRICRRRPDGDIEFYAAKNSARSAATSRQSRGFSTRPTRRQWRR